MLLQAGWAYRRPEGSNENSFAKICLGKLSTLCLPNNLLVAQGTQISLPSANNLFQIFRIPLRLFLPQSERLLNQQIRVSQKVFNKGLIKTTQNHWTYRKELRPISTGCQTLYLDICRSGQFDNGTVKSCLC